MRQLAEIRHNLSFVKDENTTEIIPRCELIFICGKLNYELGNNQKILQNISLEDYRIMVSKETLKSTIETLQEILKNIENEQDVKLA